MRTPRNERPTPWLNRRDQYRMLALVALLSVVMVAIKLAARPSSWYWLLPPEQTGTPGGDSTGDVRLEELDFRVKEEAREPLPPDVFRAVADEEFRTDHEAPGGALTADPKEPAPAADGEHQAGVSVTDEAAIPLELLSGIEDNTVGVRRAEVDAYHRMLQVVRDLPDDVRRAHTDEDVAFTVIMLQSDNYRGRLVGITGELQRLSEFPVMDNDAGIDQLYEGWMFTEDSGINPWRFVCTALPENVRPETLSLPRRVRVEGYFFKRMGYASEGGQHVAPTLLTKSFEILPDPISAAPQMQSQMRNWMLGLMALVIVGLGVLIWWFVAADRRYAGSRLHELATARLDADPQALEALKEIEPSDPSKLFGDPHDSQT